jgi:hypothetical protein
MRGTLVDRRAVLKTISAAAFAGAVVTHPQRTAAQQVKWSSGTEPPKVRAPTDAADCHHHIYDAKYPADPRSTLRPGDASVEDYRALQRRIGPPRSASETASWCKPGSALRLRKGRVTAQDQLPSRLRCPSAQLGCGSRG